MRINTAIRKKSTTSNMLRRLIAVTLIPMSIVVAVLIGILCWYSIQYRTILQNVTAASAFSQNFKNDVDLKMFYYVSDSAYSEGKPVDEVERARELADTLLSHTTQKKSIEAIESVRDLCVTLEMRMDEIDDAGSYDEGMTQLENNIYILTELIQSYMYDYLYYESAHLSQLQNEITEQLQYVILAIVGGFLILVVGIAIYASHLTDRITSPLTKLTERVKEDFNKLLAKGEMK